MTTLNDWADGVLQLLPADADGSLELTATSFPELPETLDCADLVVRRGVHDYDTWRIDYPQWYGSPEVFGCLGLAIVAALLQGATSLTMRLTSVKSEIKSLVVMQPPLVDTSSGLELHPSRFHYDVAPVVKHPWVRAAPPPDELPWFKLTNSADDVSTDAQWAERDCIHGFGSLLGSARLARLFIDLSRPSNQTVEVALECEAGFRGVAPASTEARFWLPGAFCWEAP